MPPSLIPLIQTLISFVGICLFASLILVFRWRRSKKYRQARQLEVEQILARHAQPPSKSRNMFWLDNESPSVKKDREQEGSYEAQWKSPIHAGPVVVPPHSGPSLGKQDASQDPCELPATPMRALFPEEIGRQSRTHSDFLSYYFRRDKT